MNLKRTVELSGVFLFGGILYGAVETLWRGYTHPTMLFAGGVCFTAIYCIEGKHPDLCLWQKMGTGSAVITLTELISGTILNLILDLNVWDYSHMPFDLWGQICLCYSFLWALISVPAFALCRLVRRGIGDGAIYSASASKSSSGTSVSSL